MKTRHVDTCTQADDVHGWRVHAARMLTWWLRRQPAARRRSLLALHDARARAWATTLKADASELIVPLDWLALLHSEGVLQGRRYSVLMTRWPLAWLHEQLDAAARHLGTTSLDEYRASPARVAHEMQALRGASGMVTPHAALAARLRAWAPATELVTPDWQRPSPPAATTPGRRILFPASSLARMGALELREACRQLGCGVDVLGRAQETPGFWRGLDTRQANPHDPWQDIGLVVLPAWVEPAPRVLLEALARGLTVIATPNCGLPAGTPGLRLVPPGDAAALADTIAEARPG